MPVSFRQSLNLALSALLVIIFGLCATSFVISRRTFNSLKENFTVDDLKLKKYYEVEWMVNETMHALYEYRISRDKISLISVVQLNLDEALKRLSLLRESAHDSGELRIINELSSKIENFKYTVLSYAEISASGTPGMVYIDEAEYGISVSARDLLSFVSAAVQGVREHIEDSNIQVLNVNIFFQKILILALFISAVVVVSAAILIKWAMSAPVKKLLNGAREISRGNLDYKFAIYSRDEFGELGREFGEMASSLKKTYSEVTDLKNLLLSVTDGIDEGIMLIDRDFKILWANKKIMESVGSGEVINNYCYKITHKMEEPCSAESHFCPLSETVKTGKPSTASHTHYTGGEKIFVEVSTYPFYDEKGEKRYFIHVTRDITKKMQLEEELKKNLALVERAKADMQVKMEELARFNKLAVDREIKMVELKEKIKQLEERLDNKA